MCRNKQTFIFNFRAQCVLCIAVKNLVYLKKEAKLIVYICRFVLETFNFLKFQLCVGPNVYIVNCTKIAHPMTYLYTTTLLAILFGFCFIFLEIEFSATLSKFPFLKFLFMKFLNSPHGWDWTVSKSFPTYFFIHRIFVLNLTNDFWTISNQKNSF